MVTLQNACSAGSQSHFSTERSRCFSRIASQRFAMTKAEHVAVLASATGRSKVQRHVQFLSRRRKASSQGWHCSPTRSTQQPLPRLSQATAWWCRQGRSVKYLVEQSSTRFSDHLSTDTLCSRATSTSLFSHPQPRKPIIEHIQIYQVIFGQLVMMSSIESLNTIQTRQLAAVLQFGSDIQPDRGGKRHNQSLVFKKRISNYSFTSDLACILNDLGRSTSLKNKSTSALLAVTVSAKIEDGNIRVRLIRSKDKPAEN